MVHIRHPFDILVSMFDAWTSTATAEFNKTLIGKTEAECAEMRRHRDELRARGIDAYVLSRMNQVATHTLKSIARDVVLGDVG